MMFDCCKISVSTLKQVSQFVVLPELPYLSQENKMLNVVKCMMTNEILCSSSNHRAFPH